MWGYHLNQWLGATDLEEARYKTNWIYPIIIFQISSCNFRVLESASYLDSHGDPYQEGGGYYSIGFVEVVFNI